MLGEGDDVSGLVGRYSVRAPTWQKVFYPTVTAYAVLRPLRESGPNSPVDQILDVVVAVCASLATVLTFLPSFTEVTAEGIRVRQTLVTWSTPWARVRGLREGIERGNAVVLDSGSTRRLPALPSPIGQHLRTWLAQRPAR